MTGIEIIAAERETHLGRGYDADSDDGHSLGELSMAAAACAAVDQIYVREEDGGGKEVHFIDPWPVDFDTWDPREKVAAVLESGGRVNAINARIHLLAISGSLIAAEIDRLQRLLPEESSCQE